MTLERFKDVYNDPVVVGHSEQRKQLDESERLLFDAHLAPGMAVLDLGVGAGRTTPYLASLASRYVGVDYSHAMVSRCRQLFPALSFVELDASDMSAFVDGSVDAIVFSFNGIDYIPTVERRRRCLSECARLLKPGGVFIFSTHNARYLAFTPTLDAVSPWKKAWRIALAATHTIRLTRRFAGRPFWTGAGYVVDHLAYGLLTYTATPARVTEEVQEFGFTVMQIVNARHPMRRAAWATPWYYYACRRTR